MVGRLLGGVFNMVGGILGGGGNQFARSAPASQGKGNDSWMKHSWPGLKHSWPGKSGSAPGKTGATPPGLAKKGEDHTAPEVKKSIDDNFTPQQATPPPVELKPGKDKEQGPPEMKGPPEVIGRKGPAGNDPKISQFSPEGAPTDYNGTMACGPTVGAMVARNVGYEPKMSEAELIANLGKVAGTTDQGTTGNGMIAMYEHMGLDTNAAKGADLAYMQSELQAGHHVTALGDYYEVPGHTEDNKTSGHYLDVTGMDLNGDFLVNDPANTTLERMTAAEMSKFIGSAENGGFVISAWKPTGAPAIG